MNAVNIGKENFQEILDSEKKVLLDFWAPWCGPCRMVAPVLEQIAQERGDLLVGKVNIDEEPELAGRFGIVSIPTLVVMEGGQVLRQSVGAMPKERILALLREEA